MLTEEIEQPAQSQDAEPDYSQAHYGSSGESNLKGFAQAVLGGVGRSYVRLGRNFHAEIAGQGRAKGADHKGDGDHLVTVFVRRPTPVEQEGDGDHEPKKNLVFSLEERHGSLLDAFGYLRHAGGSFRSFVDFLGFPPSEEQSKHSKRRQDNG